MNQIEKENPGLVLKSIWVKSTLPKSGPNHIAISHNFLPHIRNHEIDKIHLWFRAKRN
jgi:hypothetical protein